ncbi:MAG: CoA transferase [Pseudomonadota bacterium]
MSGHSTAHEIAGRLAAEHGWTDPPLDWLAVAGTPSALATDLPIADMATAAQGLVGLSAAALHARRGGPEQTVTVDRRAASMSMTASAYLLVNGERATAWDPLTGYFAAADGWVYLHCQFAHLRDRLLAAFGLPNDPDTVRAALAGMPAQKIEDVAAAAGVCAIMRRDRATWQAHPHGRHLAGLPVLQLGRQGCVTDAPYAQRPVGCVRDAPLSGVRVLDLSRVIAGPMIGRTLAEHGADVLRIAGPELPFFEGLVINTGFGKRAAHIDLTSDAGREAFASLVRDADVVIDGYRPGALARRGFGPESLRALQPDLIYLTLSAFGETGPWGGRPGFDTYVQGATGLSQDGPDGPTRLPCQPLDYLTGYLGAATIMTALRRRLDEGGGWHAELSLARMAMWIWQEADRHGRDPDAPAANPDIRDVDELRWEMASEFGVLSALAPAVHLSETPPRWRTPPVPLGTHAPEWLSQGTG